MPSSFISRFKNTFRSLRKYNYRLWAVGTLVSNIGTWMQRIAQDWVVLTVLTHHSGTAVGVIMALQFGPPILLMPIVGAVVDHFSLRKLLVFTQLGLSLTALLLGILVLSGKVNLWKVYLIAGIMGCISAFDSPARQTFVAELVGDNDLINAVALNSSLFNSAQLIGPAISGVLISIIGAGWVFIINSISFLAVIISLFKMNVNEFHLIPKTAPLKTGMLVGLKYIKNQPELMVALIMLFLVGTYGLNFPVFISTMSLTVFHGGAHLYGFLSSMIAVGSIIGALHVAGRKSPNINLLIISSFSFALVGVLAAFMPNVLLFGLLLSLLGANAQIFTTSTNSLVQLSTLPSMRGRVMAIYMGIFLGCTPLGAPVVGWLADVYGPRVSLAVGASSGFLACLVGVFYKFKSKKVYI